MNEFLPDENEVLIVIRYHIIFSTKKRQPLIRPEIQKECWKIIRDAIRNVKSSPTAVGGSANHVHLLIDQNAENIGVSLDNLITEIKRTSASQIRSSIPGCADFGWQDDYIAVGFSIIQEPDLVDHILNQNEYHKTTTFKEEVLSLLDEYKIEYDKDEVFD